MSAKGRGPSSGGAEDYFTTPSWCVRRFLERWRPRARGHWVEPGAGNGAIIRSVEAFAPGLVPVWHAIEIRAQEQDALMQAIRTGTIQIADLLKMETNDVEPWRKLVTVVIGNPPYNRAFEFLMMCHFLFPFAEIAFLLRQAFTASAERFEFMSAHFPDKFELPDRPSFTGGGGDSADYAWMVWPPEWERIVGAGQLLAQTSDVERSRDRGHFVAPVDPQARLF